MHQRQNATHRELPRHLHDLQARNRADQQAPAWHRLYASRFGVAGTVNELVNGHQMRRCRYRGTAKAHVQHVLTAIAVNIERLSAQDPTDSACRPRSPTAFQQYLDARGLPRPRWWRQGQGPSKIKIPDGVAQSMARPRGAALTAPLAPVGSSAMAEVEQ
ncbi:transposase [Streptomyces sp. NPDC052052]|uniref:transposase n=1 Tax=Streptomyces sp. NPDC052052 TaxID=3154756 RepID=UPI003440CEBB